MDQMWQETNALLDSIYQAYNSILQELETTTNRKRAMHLRAKASACVAAYRATVREYQAAKRRAKILSP
jgi:inactivated superfamily I helicase